MFCARPARSAFPPHVQWYTLLNSAILASSLFPDCDLLPPQVFNGNLPTGFMLASCFGGFKISRWKRLVISIPDEVVRVIWRAGALPLFDTPWLVTVRAAGGLIFSSGRWLCAADAPSYYCGMFGSARHGNLPRDEVRHSSRRCVR
jgi:hypothetical protein